MADPLVVEVHVGDDGRIARVLPRGEIDLATARILVESLDALGPEVELVVVDLAGVAFIDSSGINAIIRTHAERDGRVRIANPSAGTVRVLEVLDLLDLVEPVGSARLEGAGLGASPPGYGEPMPDPEPGGSLDELVDIEDAAQLLEVPVQQVLNMIDQGLLDAEDGSSGPRVRRADVLAVHQQGG